MKCNWKVIRILPTRSNDLDLDQILLDVHNFLVVSIIYDIKTRSGREKLFQYQLFANIDNILISNQYKKKNERFLWWA